MRSRSYRSLALLLALASSAAATPPERPSDSIDRIDPVDPSEIHVAPSEQQVLVTFQWTTERRARKKRALWFAETLRGDVWTRVASGRARPNRLEAFVLPAATEARQVRLRFARRSLRIEHLDARPLDPSDAGPVTDAWLFVGASIQERAVDHGTFQRLARERFGRSPLAFNEAVGGWDAARLARELPGILERRPWAPWVAIHIGGGEVTAFRPYPGGADKLRSRLRRIVEIVQAAGRVPILARISWRAYGSEAPDPKGSGPYNVHVVDPLIAELTPRFSDPETGRGRVDPYGWLQAHPEALADRVHLTNEAEPGWLKLWLEGAGPIIYGEAAEARERAPEDAAAPPPSTR